MSSQPFISRIRIKNYKSIAKCDVELGRLTLLVGRNGCGKSNFLDAIRFILDGLQTSLDHAIKSRGGIDEVRRRSTGHPHNFSISIQFDLPDADSATYAFELAARPKGGFVVKEEQMKVFDAHGRVKHRYRVLEGVVDTGKTTLENMPPGVPDRLYLVNASGRQEFLAPYQALLAMGFYNLNPEQMRDVQSPDAGELLRRDGSNVASVVARLQEDKPEVKERIRDYLQVIVPGIADFERIDVGHKETLRFRQEIRGAAHPWRFHAASMSDGTLRSLGILVAAMQFANRQEPIHLVGIEEPESALHPAAAGALMDSLREAVLHTQVLLTTHSPDFLDEFNLERESLLVLQSHEGDTTIAPADSASLEAIKKHLYKAGDLLRMDQLQPDASHVEKQLQLDVVFD